MLITLYYNHEKKNLFYNKNVYTYYDIIIGDHATYLGPILVPKIV